MAFKETRIFLSRKFFPPEVIDSLHDVLRENGAEVCICSNPSCNSSTDFHVLPSLDHEKFAELRSHGCNVIGPECIMRCAKEHRPIPKQEYTCCLAMEGVKVLATGFEKQEKDEIEKIVSSMCGEFYTKASMDVTFVVAKNVLASKYKWAANNLRRPILTINWLYRCWSEHRVVPHEPYKLLPFTGLIICATNVPVDARKEIEEVALKNGGIYSADLTKKCTHLIAYVPEGDKYKVAKRWGHVKIVNRQWFSQCLTAKACLDEDLFPVRAGVTECTRNLSASQNSLDRPSISSQLSGPPLTASLLEVTKSQASFQSAPSFISNTSLCEEGQLMGNSFKGCLGDHSLQDEQSAHFSNKLEESVSQEDDLYLSDCRFFFTGFTAAELRRLVNMVRAGGGTRHMELNDRVSHIILGKPSESELKEIRQRTMWGAIQALQPSWLEECTQQRKEVTICKRHIIPDEVVLKGNPVGSITHVATAANTNVSENPEGSISHVAKAGNIFKGHGFGFSEGFPKERREEIVQWVLQGGGLMKDDASVASSKGTLQVAQKIVDFVIVCHGVKSIPHMYDVNTKLVSSHWIRYCLEEGKMLDLESHVLYRPLPCQVPFPGFESLRFCVTQYEDRDRLLLRNLCYVLGAKFTEKLNKKVTHLLCKVRNGQKYEASKSWGIQIITADWLFACVAQNKLVPLDDFQPRDISAAERDAVFFAMTQCPSQAVRHAAGELGSQWEAGPAENTGTISVPIRSVEFQAAAREADTSQITGQARGNLTSPAVEASLDPWDEQIVRWSGEGCIHSREGDLGKDVGLEQKLSISKVTRAQRNFQTEPGVSSPTCFTPHVDIGRFMSQEVAESDTDRLPIEFTERSKSEEKVEELITNENNHESCTDVAAAIEGLLAQTSKVKCSDTSGKMEVELLSPEHTAIRRIREEQSLHSEFKRPKKSQSSRVMERPGETSISTSLEQDAHAFDESQLDSQVIGYDEDHTGRQIIMERVRTRSMYSKSIARQSDKATSWKSDGLGRLFKAAEANK